MKWYLPGALALPAQLSVLRAAQQSPASTQPPQGGPRVRAGAVVRPDTVTVADPFTFTVTVEVPRDARVEWPSLDSAAVVSQRAPVQVRDVPGVDSRQETAVYQLAAWDTGAVAIGLPHAVVRLSDGVVRVPLDAQVYVRSILPADTSQHVPKPARDLFPREVPWWELWWPVAAVLLALALLYWLWRRRRHRKGTVTAPAPLDIYTRAMNDFDRLDRLALADSGERGRYVALAVEVLRTYLTGRVRQATLSQTSSELVTAVRDDTRVPVTRLAPLLGETDAIKFARYPIDLARARVLAAEARGVVDDIERAERERLAAVAAEEAAAQQARRGDREREEDEARRRSRRKGAA